jgi:histidinol-phosphate aminotransferase
MARREIVEEMNKVRAPFNTNSLAQAAALSALADEEHLRRSREVNEEGKEYLYRELSSMGLRFVPTEANFIYVTLEGDSNELYKALLRRGVIVRPMGPDAIRVTVGLPGENGRFVESLKAVMK